VEALLAFTAALVALRFAGDLFARFRARRAPHLAAWAASLVAYAVACAALAWGAAAGWDDIAFRVYYLAGGLLTAPLLGVGSLLLRGHRWAISVAIAYVGVAVGVMLAEPLTASVSGTEIPDAQAHLDGFPARVLAALGNSLGTLAVVAVAIVTIRRDWIGNALLLAGVVLAAAGTALTGLGESDTALFILAAVVLLYAGFLKASGERFAPIRSFRRGPRRAGRTA
jgi:hypothetical protein